MEMPKMINIEIESGDTDSKDDGIISVGGRSSTRNGSVDESGMNSTSSVTSSGGGSLSGIFSRLRGKTYGNRETQAVQRLRILLVIILLAVIAIAVVGYVYLENSRQEQFEQEFEAQASKVIEGFQSDALIKMQSMEALSSSITSYAMDMNMTWPFVRIQNSAHVLEPYLTLSGAASIVIMPIVGARQRVAWEEYSVANAGWIDEDVGTVEAQQSTSDTSHHNERHREAQYLTRNDENWETSISPYIKNYVGLDVSPGPWITWWQYAPVIKNHWFVNFNRLAYESFDSESHAILGGKAAISRTQSFEPGLDFQSTRDFTFTTDLLNARGNSGYTPGELIGYLYYPVFEDYEGEKVVSILMMSVYWKSYFEGILPKNAKGMVCVVKNNVG